MRVGTFRRGWATSTYADSCPPRSYWLETVWSLTWKLSGAWCFGIPQMPLPPFTEISVLTGRS